MGHELHARVARLERSARRAWVLAGAAAMALVAMPLIALGPGASLLRAQRVEAGRLEAREIALVDESGNELALLRVGAKGGEIVVMDAAGAPVVSLGARDGSRRVVHVADPGRRGWGVMDEADTPEARAERDDARRDARLDAERPEENVLGVRLRAGVEASDEERSIAAALVSRGWYYVMPRPKSGAASWDNDDARTTWFNGYWKNERTGAVSSSRPDESDFFAGDGETPEEWRRGGAPRRPTVIEWLCSREGGVKPEGE